MIIGLTQNKPNPCLYSNIDTIHQGQKTAFGCVKASLMASSRCDGQKKDGKNESLVKDSNLHFRQVNV